MKQLIQNLKTGETLLENIPVPRPGRGQLLIQTTLSLVSLGTERMLVEFGKANLFQKAKQQPDKVRQVIDSLDDRGSWVEKGRLRYQGEEDTTDRIIDCRTFINNCRLLSSFLAAESP